MKREKIYKTVEYGWTHTQQQNVIAHIWVSTYTKEGYRWAHKQVYGWTYTQQPTGEYMHDKRAQVGTYTNIWVSTYTAEGYG